MRTKLIVIIILSILVSFSLEAKKKSDIKYELLYFHATLRCAECIKIEDYINSTLKLSFEKEIESGKLKFQSIDFLEPENEKFPIKYKFDNQTLILRKLKNGKEIKWKNLDLIWEKLEKLEDFKNYIEKEYKKF